MSRFPACSVLFLMLLAAPAVADPATLLGAFNNWSAYQTGSGSDMTCYALSQPRASQPRGARREPIYVMVSDYPGRKIKAEPQLVPGYEYKAGLPATLAVGADKFVFFTRNDAKVGKGWLQALNENQHLIDIMAKGVSAVVAGTSARGTKTTDTYSLAGFNEALAKIHSACGM